MENADQIRTRLGNVYWIGGGSGAGKSTIAKRLVEEFDLHYYSTDETIREHGSKTPAEECPQVQKFNAMDMDERWLTRSPEVMLDTFHFFRGECFDRIVEDLLAIDPARKVLIEGFRLLPHLVQPLLLNPKQSVWFLPTPEFRRMAFEARGSLYTIAGKTSDPECALQNLLDRDAMFTERLKVEVNDLDLPSKEIDTSIGEDELYNNIVQRFCL